MVFLIGGNGSRQVDPGHAADGLYQPVSGRILLDRRRIAGRNGYLGLFSCHLRDYHLFGICTCWEPEPKEALVAEWLEQFADGQQTCHRGWLSCMADA